MAEDLTLKVIALTDSFKLEAGGAARQVTKLQYMLGKFGPFHHEFDHKPERHEIDAVVTARRATLQGLT